MEWLIIWLVTAVSLLIISRIELFGIEIENFGTALIVAVVLGLLNAVLRPVLNFFLLSAAVVDIWPVQRCRQCCGFRGRSGSGQWI